MRTALTPIKKFDQAGFTLVEMAVVIVIIGLVMGGGMAVIGPLLSKHQISKTQHRMDVIAKRLATHVHSFNRLPCPASPDETIGTPFGSERNSGATGQGMGVCVSGDEHGIVPFRVLGLTAEQVKDGWGNFITYHVSPVFAINPFEVNSPGYINDTDFNEIHEQCRTNTWVEVPPPPAPSFNRNPTKARFCCPQIANIDFDEGEDIILRNTDGSTIEDLFERSGNAADYDQPNVLATMPIDNTSETVAYVLLSHGPNGHGAYLGNQSEDQFTVPGLVGVGDDEIINGTVNSVFIRGDRVDVDDNTHFDDILIWRTQNQVYNEFGNDSCHRP